MLTVFQESDLASVIVGLIQVVFTAVAALIMDRAGRKILLIISGIYRHSRRAAKRLEHVGDIHHVVCFPMRNPGVAMAISTTAFGVYFYLITAAGGEPPTDLAWLALVSMAVFITGELLAHG